MRKSQAIFRAVIQAGYYGADCDQEQYMCLALKRAHNDKCITPEEDARACKAITRYTRALTPDLPCSTMRMALNLGAGQDHSRSTWEQGAGRDFYWNWYKRPRKTNNA